MRESSLIILRIVYLWTNYCFISEFSFPSSENKITLLAEFLGRVNEEICVIY